MASIDRICISCIATLALLGLAGCVAAAPEPEPVVRVSEVLAGAATQVRRCYRAPRVSSEARQIVTTLRVFVNPDGQISRMPEIVAQTGLTERNRTQAAQMAQAAIGAVMRCQPILLPEPVREAGWTDFDLTFSPLARG